MIRRVLPLAALLLASVLLHAQGSELSALGVGSSPVASVTWTLIQHLNNFTCAASNSSGNQACSITGVTTTAGDWIGLHSSATEDIAGGTGSMATPTFVSATGDTLTHCASPIGGSQSDSGSSPAAQWFVSDCAFKLSATGGTGLTFTWTWNFPAGTTSTPEWASDVELLEYRRSTGTATYDTGNNKGSTACTSCGGPAITLGSSSDLVLTWIASGATLTGPGAPYTNPIDLDNSNVQGGFAGALNQSSYSTPTWANGTSKTAVISVAAFK